MKTYILNFNLEDWVKHLEIEAESEQDAMEKLSHMTTQEIVDNAVMYDCACITDVDITCKDPEDEEVDEDED